MERQVCEVQLILRQLDPVDFFDISDTGTPDNWTESLCNLRNLSVTMSFKLEVELDADYAYDKVNNLRKSLRRMNDKEFVELQQRLPHLSRTLTLLCSTA